MNTKEKRVRWNAQKQVVEERKTDHKGKQISRITYTYNAQGKLVRDVYYDAGNEVVVTHVYAYK